MRSRKTESETILFAVTGFSPAVLTETVWALAREKPPVIPDRVVVMTTSAGRGAIERELFTPCGQFKNLSAWTALRDALGRAGNEVDGKLGFGLQDIGVFFRRSPKTGATSELGDILSPGDNAAVADQILENLRRFTENPDIRVIASIAGGRKTMGALLFSCMSLIGRETDRVTHVLINPPYDDPRHEPRFFFPAGCARGSARTPSPKIMLADIPFVPLRNRFKDIGEMPGGYTRLVAEYSSVLKDDDIAPVTVALDDSRRTVFVDDLPVKLPERLYFLLLYLVHINKRKTWPAKQESAVDEIREFLGKAFPDRLGCAPPDGEELRKRLYSLRRAFPVGIRWAPGRREQSLRLPPFHLK